MSRSYPTVHCTTQEYVFTLLLHSSNTFIYITYYWYVYDSLFVTAQNVLTTDLVGMII